ncbi:YlcI/YnfO family protein [Methylobacterium sp. Gmos1]
MIRFRPGTMERVDAVLVEQETRADFVRQAVEDALKRRTRSIKGEKKE